MEIREAIARVIEGNNLSEQEAQRVMEVVMNGEATSAQIGALLAALRIKGETVDEITGFARTMRIKAVPLVTRHQDLIDTCGTGGDGRQTFNISTTSAFVVAGAGLPVAKHGNRSVSSRCGSADVLEQLGVEVNLPAEAVQQSLDTIGIGFLFAPLFHNAMKHAIGPRREIGIRTVFNVLGPLTNPAQAPTQVVGVYAAGLTETLAEVLGRLGSRNAFVVHGSDGIDEVTITGETRVTQIKDGDIRTFNLIPEDAGLQRSPLEALIGGTAEHNAAIARDILQGSTGPRRDVVVLNAALALVAGGKAENIREGADMAEKSIDSGSALEKLQMMAAFSKRWVA